MSAFTRDEIVAQLVARNIPRHLAERAADAEILGLVGRRNGKSQVIGELVAASIAPPAEAPPAAAIAWPVRLLLPWSYLVSDNDRKEPYVAQTPDGPRARMRLTARYAAGMQKIANVARATIGDAAAHEGPLSIDVRVWMPTGSARNDAINFSKIVHDALEGVVYRNDNLLHDTHWTRAGVDVDAPRAEVTITPIPSPP